jgi:hypothetical protein
MTNPRDIGERFHSEDGRTPRAILHGRGMTIHRAGLLLVGVIVMIAGIAVGSSLPNLRDSSTAGGSVVPSVPMAIPSSSVLEGVQSPDAIASGLTENAAVNIARANAPRAAEGRVLSARLGNSGTLLSSAGLLDISAKLQADRQVWVISLAVGDGLGAEGSTVVVDFLDGHVYGAVAWRS